MADIFLSYASEDRERARLVAQLLEGQSLTVWWDRKIPAGVAYDEPVRLVW
ncbi:MAG: TIR domain-containing protein [Cyanobacteria bacterium]|nr:TIR domain-containing protein [Cyanobacteriota bacterium]